MTNNSIQDAVTTFVKAIKESEEYREYDMQLTKLKRQPELCERVNAFREKNFMMQNTEESEALMDAMEELEKEYQDLRENPMVGDFLDAETAFCRMMQDIDMRIIKELDFQ